MSMEQKTGWWESVAVGALTQGVNNPTVVLLNVVLFALLLCLMALLPIAYGYGGYLFLHVFLLIFLVALLLLLINWFIAQTGIVAAEVQMAELSPPQREADESGKEHKSVPDPLLERKKAD